MAWWLALDHPDRVRTLAALNVPHPTVMERTLRRSWDQRRRSWYVAAFQVPRVPELAAKAGNYRLFERSLRESSRPGTFDDADIERYRAAWDKPGALTAMVNWYRAVARYPPPERTDPVDPPTLVLWGRGTASSGRRWPKRASPTAGTGGPSSSTTRPTGSTASSRVGWPTPCRRASRRPTDEGKREGSTSPRDCGHRGTRDASRRRGRRRGDRPAVQSDPPR
ncbi:hypothetical protein ACFQL0_04675 [Haloplanus litoreus]|uniref:hypothetical protein n=1 Tax=Haloplanus litoreus TaxID=767515 RepID=UPI00360DFD0E